ncbi:MAG: alginate O-acetyltransferase AlgX-related protein [Anaerovoracaceae bacterium]|jgi:hypothetical protein
MKRFAEILIICCFTVFIAVCMVATVGNRAEKYSYYENRDLASMPAAVVKDIMDGDYFDSLESFLIDHSAFRNTSVKTKTKLDIDVFKRPVVNDIVVQDDILLSYCEYDGKNPDDVPEQVAEITPNLKAVSDATESYGGYYCYVAVPPQFYCHADDYPWYMDNWSSYVEAEVPALEKSLESQGVNFLDLGPVFEADGMPEEYSSRVDNHYGMQGAFRTYQAILEKINEDTGSSIHVLDDSEVDITKVENPYLGAYERKILNLRDIDESLYKLTVENPVDFAMTINGSEVQPHVYNEPDDTTTEITYQYYMGGDLPEAVIDTHRPELPSVLIYGDSFTDAVECILYNSFDKMYTIDMRYYDKSTVSEFIEKYKPDYVICIRDYEALLDATANGGK